MQNNAKADYREGNYATSLEQNIWDHYQNAIKTTESWRLIDQMKNRQAIEIKGKQFNDAVLTVLSELMKSIKACETAIFCGAGISLNSGLPGTNYIVRYVLEKLSITDQEIKAIENSNLPFEAFVEILQANSDISRFLDVFDLGTPNTSHILLAKMVKAKYLKNICTTNFDRLIECAFEQEEMELETAYQVIYKESDIDSIDWNDKKAHIIKVHGTVEDKANMAITLRQVANRILSYQRKKVVKRIFSQGTREKVLILGYSCSDVFDISSHIESFQSSLKNIIFIEHPEKENKQKEGTVEDVRVKSQKNPFKKFPGKRIVFDTDQIIKYIWENCLNEKYQFFAEEKEKRINDYLWKRCVDEWLEDVIKIHSKSVKYHFAGKLLSSIGKYKEASDYFRKAINKSKGN